MARGRPGLSKTDYVTAALDFIDEHGMEPLTMRALGEKMGVDPTAVYRHYPNKDDLVLAVCDRVFEGLVASMPGPEVEPRARIHGIAVIARDTFRRHPHVTSAIVNSTGYMENGFAYSRTAAQAIVDLGVPDDRVAIVYQMFEGYIMGSSLQDFTSSPHNWAIRRARYRALDLPQFDAVSGSEEAVRDVADAAFLATLDAILDSAVAR